MSSTPIQPDLPLLRRRAKDLLRAANAADPASVQFLHTNAPGIHELKLATAQLAVARSEGYSSWSQLKKAAENAASPLLFEAVAEGNKELTATLLKRYPACAKHRNEYGATLLHTSVYADDPEMVRLLLNAGVPRDELWDSSAHTPLSWATTMGSWRVAKVLMDAGASMDLFTSAGLGELDRVKSFWIDGKLEANPSRTGSSRFDESGAPLPRPPESRQDQVSDALYFASRSGHADVVQWLLAHGGDPNFRGYEGGTCLHWGEFSNSNDVCRALREAGGSDDLLDYTFRATPRAFGMICPAAYGMVDRLRHRLDTHPEDVNILGGFGTPLNAAAWNNQAGTLILLLERGADRNLRNVAGLTPLEVARARGYGDLARMLDGNTEHG